MVIKFKSWAGLVFSGILDFMAIKLLLLQIRENPQVRVEEHLSFAKHGKINLDQIDIHNVFDRPDFSADILEGYDGLFIGGASEASVLETESYPFVNNIISLCRACIEKDIPVFASCFGFQAAILAFGGQITRDEIDFEMGTINIKLAESLEHDPLFSEYKDSFPAVSVHKESALELPAHCELLAYTDKCVHAFKYKDKPFWATQFHPELDRKCLTARLNVYQKQYTESAHHFDEIIAGLQETPQSNQLVEKFITFLHSRTRVSA